MQRFSGYPPISDYALIGNRHTCALVSRNGSIDWCCLPHLESPSVFAAILDASRAGRWRVAPAAGAKTTRSYVGSSAVLETRFTTDSGVLLLQDFLPIRAGRGEEPSRSAYAIVRMARCLEGEVDVDVEWKPRPNYARDDVTLERTAAGFAAVSKSGTAWLAGVPDSSTVREAAVHARVRLTAGEELPLICGWGGSHPVDAAELARAYLEETLEWWAGWESDCAIEPVVEPWREQVLRSGMVLQLLTNERTGAMAAAPTTSLPEEIGGVRNWDYRFCWVRDASMTSRAFLALGRRGDAIAFLHFLEKAASQHRDPARIQVLYGLNGETRMPEYNLGHLDGYEGSRPVRIGNGAALQRQLDVYGELLEAAYDLLSMGGELSEGQEAWLRGVADYTCDVWKLPDAGIWEVRGPERHFTYSKLMCWVALDRAMRIAHELDWDVDTARWRMERDEIRRAILEEGFDPVRGTFVQSFGESGLDAATLLIPLVGFLPASDPRVQSTIDAVLRGLTRDGLVYRYIADEAEDGVAGGEGAFAICTFWLIDALALSGRVDEAQELFDQMLRRANDVGLYSEEIEPGTGAFLGNFPQAFSHIGLINSAHFLGRAIARGAPQENPGTAERSGSGAAGPAG